MEILHGNTAAYLPLPLESKKVKLLPLAATGLSVPPELSINCGTVDCSCPAVCKLLEEKSKKAKLPPLLKQDVGIQLS